MPQLLATLSLLIAVSMPTLATAAEMPRPTPRAHAHNDYEHMRPLLDALDQGFCSVEADIFLRNGQLLVAHSAFELKPERTLEKLYLAPLAERVKQNGGRVFKDGPTFTLLIDLKSAGDPTYRALDALLAKYAGILSTTRDGKFTPQAIQVVISGDRPKELIEKQSLRFAGIDGRLTDLDSNAPSHLLPMISDNWTIHFTWRGRGDFPPAEREKLHTIVAKAHERGRVVRFWATPEEPALWRELHDAGVDLINTDRLKELREFLAP